jgi:predicted SAM-dependent methyltransferase
MMQRQRFQTLWNVSFGRLGERFKDKLRCYRFKARIKSRPVRLVIGASGIYDKGWVPSDVSYLNLLNEDHWRRYFDGASIDAILAEHVWEHLTVDEGMEAARRCLRYLKPGGYLRVAVPDGLHPDAEYIEYVRPGGCGAGADDHKVLYNHRSFSDVFERAGFQISLLEYFDENGAFNCADWDVDDGRVNRSKRFDQRNAAGSLKYTSIILDARRPSAPPEKNFG